MCGCTAIQPLCWLCLAQVQDELGGAKQTVEDLQTANQKLQVTNQTLNARVHRLELQRNKLEESTMELARKPWIAEGLFENVTTKQENEKLK